MLAEKFKKPFVDKQTSNIDDLSTLNTNDFYTGSFDLLDNDADQEIYKLSISIHLNLTTYLCSMQMRNK